MSRQRQTTRNPTAARKPSRNAVIRRSKHVLSGTPVFRGTRVPVRTLLEYLEAGDRLDDFLKDFPTVSRRQALQFLELAKKAMSSSDYNILS